MRDANIDRAPSPRPATARAATALPVREAGEATDPGARDPGSPWIAAQRARIERVFGVRGAGDRPAAADLAGATVPAPGRMDGASAEPVQRVLRLDDQPIDDAGALEDLDEDLQDLAAEFIALPGPAVEFTRAQLGQVDQFLEAGTRPADRAAIVATVRLVSAGTFTGSERRSLETFNSPRVMENLGAYGSFLRENPNLRTTLGEQGVGFEMGSTHGLPGGMGGAAVIDDTIHVSDDVLMSDPEHFLRTAVHETGHASFQRLLLTVHGLRA